MKANKIATIGIVLAILASFTLVPVNAEANLPDLTVTDIKAYHYITPWGRAVGPWFNLPNSVDVTVSNIGLKEAGAAVVFLSIDGERIGSEEIRALQVGESATVTFKWTPTGQDPLSDSVYNYTLHAGKDYTLTAEVVGADVDNNEKDMSNNVMTKTQKVLYTGYMADEPLENLAHGMLHGHVLYTTGDGRYTGLYRKGSTQTTHYAINLPPNATVKLARLNVYYTWSKALDWRKVACPEMQVDITTPSGTTYTNIPLDAVYNDIKAHGYWNLPWGNYVFDLSGIVSESGTYTVTVKNVCTKCRYFCVAAPGIAVVYEDADAPLIEYWYNEGADTLMGGRRYDGLTLEECINNAEFPGTPDATGLGLVERATLGVVSPWGGSAWAPGMTNYLYFNDNELGQGVYRGYSSPYTKTIGSLTLSVGGYISQVGINVTDVTEYLRPDKNVASQGDDGDNMMPSNAFLVLEYETKGVKDEHIKEVTGVTGGGWMSEETATFGFVAQLKDNETIGNLEYIDHAADLAMHSDTIDELEIIGNTATFSGTAWIDDASSGNVSSGYTFEINVEDNGEPGAGLDTFAISVTDPEGSLYYSASGTLEGGNIQIHV